MNKHFEISLVLREVDVPFLARRMKKNQVEMMFGSQGKKPFSVSALSLVDLCSLVSSPAHRLRTS